MTNMAKAEIIENVARNLAEDFLHERIEDMSELEVNYLESSNEYCVNYGDELLFDGLTEKEAEEIRAEIEDAVFSQVFDFNAIEINHEYMGEEFEEIDGKKYMSYAWHVTMNYNDVEFEVDFYVGEANGCSEPSVQQVLYCVISDYFGYKDSRDFEDYCSMYGTEIDDEQSYRKAKGIYDLVAEQAETLEKMFTAEELELLSKTYQDY